MLDILEILRQRCRQAEVYHFTGESTAVSFEANTIKSAEVEQSEGIACRALVEGRLGFTAAAGHIEYGELIDNLLVSAQYGEVLPLEFPGAYSVPQVITYDPAMGALPVEFLVQVGNEIVAELREVDVDAQINVDIERSLETAYLTNTSGAQIRQQLSSFTVGISVERVDGDDVFMAADSFESIGFSTDYRQAVQRIAQRMRLARHSAALTSGRMPVLFSPNSAMVLLLPLILGTNGKNVLRGTSPLAKRLGDVVCDRSLSLWDDPTIFGMPNSGSYDDEGVPGQRKALIQDGKCHSFLYDLKTACQMGTVSTGNGMRSLLSAPSPAASNLVLSSGTTPLADIIRSIDHGLYVEDLLGLGQGNAISGAFSNAVSLAFVIEHGEIVGRVKDVAIAGNIYDDLRHVAAISSESYWVDGDILLPHILLPELNVVAV
ncbi:MAG: TldD/PmbA family protein [Anaerolineae bacterium]